MESIADEMEEISNSLSTQNIDVILEKLQSILVRLENQLESDPSLTQLQLESLLEVCSCIKNLNKNNGTKQSDLSPPSEGGTDGREKSIVQTIVKGVDVKFSSIAGLDVVKSLLHEAVILPVQYPHLFTGKVKPWKSILLYGPPG